MNQDKSATATNKKSKGFTDEEQAAMKERAKELKAEARANKNKADGESDVLAKIAEMPEPDRAMATRLHEIITASAPDLSPKTWYGMPAYARDGKVVICFFQARVSSTRGTRRLASARCEPRRRRHVADRLRAEGVDRRRRGKDRRAREESGELRSDLATAQGAETCPPDYRKRHWACRPQRQFQSAESSTRNLSVFGGSTNEQNESQG